MGKYLKPEILKLFRWSYHQTKLNIINVPTILFRT